MLTVSNPRSPLFLKLGSDFDRLFGDVLGEYSPGRDTGGAFPAVSVWEDETGYRVDAEVPGVSREELDIEVHEDEVRIRGERKESTPEGAHAHLGERIFGKFERVLRLPGKVDATKVEATLSDGVLQLTLPPHESTKPRKIALNG